MLSRVTFFLLVITCTHCTHAATIVQRDTIGPDSSWTDGMPGAAMVINSVSIPELVTAGGSKFVADNNGILQEAKFVVFASDSVGPVNSTSFFDDFHLTFNLWNDGIQNGIDSFANNPVGTATNGHVREVVWDPSVGVTTASIAEFGHTGPPGNEFLHTTFLITVDLLGYDIPIENGREYVFNVVLDINAAPTLEVGIRLLGSTAVIENDEDVWFNSDIPTITPGFVNSQQNAGFELFGTYLSINTDSADFDTDTDVDGADFLAWQRGFGTTGGATKSQGDANDDGDVNALDLAVWEKQYGDVATPLAMSVTVPEPTSAALLLMSFTILITRRRSRYANGDHPY